MIKAKSLIDALKASKAPRCGTPSWDEVFRARKPKVMEEIDKAIDLWLNDDKQMRAAMPSITSLAKNLLPYAEMKSQSTLISYIRRRENERSR